MSQLAAVTYVAADFTTTNGGVTPGVQWQGVLIRGSIGQSLYAARSARSGQVLEATQNVAKTVSVFMQDENTGLGLPGLASLIVIQIRKPALGFVTITPTITDRTLGRYDIALTGPNLDTIGVNDFHITATGAALNDDLEIDVIAINKNDAVRLGLSSLPNAAAGSLGGLSAQAIRSGTAQGAGNGVNQIQLDAGASAVDGFYSRSLIKITGGTGAGQSRNIANYVGSTKMATANRNWATQPDATSVFEISALSSNLLTEGLAQAGSANTITFRSNDSSVTDTYKDEWVHIVAGTGTGQSRYCSAYDGTTKIATVDKNWVTNPDATSVYQILTGADVTISPTVGVALTTDVTTSTSTLAADITASTTTLAADITASTTAVLAAIPSAATIRDAILDAARSGHLTAGSIGEGIALATSLLQGNFYIDNVDNTDPNGPTTQRLRCFVSAAAMAGVTYGGTAQGEFATFHVATTYDGVNKIHDHKVVQL